MPLMNLNGFRIYMPTSQPSETPEARRARHYRRYLQVQAGTVEAPPDIPSLPAAGLDAAALQQGGSQ